jgi:diguanylate cyclase (GGDEF)-like protein
MQIVAYPPLVMAAINVFVGILHLFIFLRRRRPLAHLPFALLCFCVALYDIFCVGLYNSRSTVEGVVWQRLQICTGFLISVFLIWFVVVFTAQKRKLIMLLFMGWFIVALAASTLLSPSLTVSATRPSTKNLVVFGNLGVTYYEGEIGLFFIVVLASTILAYLYFLILLYRWYRQTREKHSLVIFAALLFYFIGVINDLSIATRVYSFVYLSEYAFMVIIFAMSYVLLDEFVGLYLAIEAANRGLEQKVRERTCDIEILNKELQRQAELDSLTGIYNRRFFSEYIEIELRRARNRLEHSITILPGANDMNFGLAIIDVDHFKRVNDTYGHPAGDRVLVEIVRRIQGSIFSRDIFCRYGGEEFIVLFTRTSREGIVSAVDKIRRSVEEQRIALQECAEPLPITVSIGVAIFEDVANMTSDQIIRLADERLLTAKNTGRNKIVYR